MKKNISLLIICLLAIISLTACGSTSTSELDELQQQVEALEARISELKKTEKEPNLTEETTSNSPETTENSTKLEYLDSLIEFRLHNQIEIVQSNYVTETQLLAVAQKCANLNYYIHRASNLKMQIEIATALSENPVTTDAVMAELFNSSSTEVVAIALQWFNRVENK